MRIHLVWRQMEPRVSFSEMTLFLRRQQPDARFTDCLQWIQRRRNHKRARDICNLHSLSGERLSEKRRKKHRVSRVPALSMYAIYIVLYTIVETLLCEWDP